MTKVKKLSDSFITKNHGTNQIELQQISTEFRPVELHYKADGAMDNSPSLCILMVHPSFDAVHGQISLNMLTKALYELGYELKEKSKKYRRYQFKTKATVDYRPLKFDSRYPWWWSGKTQEYVTIVAYLPSKVNLKEYWDDAYDIAYTETDSIEFSDRFPKPDYYIEDKEYDITKEE